MTDNPAAVVPGTREALEPFAKIADDLDRAYEQRVRHYADEGHKAGPPNKDSEYVSVRVGWCRAARAALSAPVPPADGARVQSLLCDMATLLPPKPVTIGDVTHAYHDPNAAKHLLMLRAIFDQLLLALPSGTGAAEPECAVCGGRREVGGFVSAESGYQTEPCPACALPPVRGDRELLDQCAKIAQQFELDMSNSQLDDRDIENIKRGASEASSAVERAILSLPVQSSATVDGMVDRELLAETIHKARYLPDRTPMPFADEDKNGRAYCFRIADAVFSLSGQSAPVGAREVVKECVRFLKLHATEMRNNNLTLVPDGLDAIAEAMRRNPFLTALSSVPEATVSGEPDESRYIESIIENAMLTMWNEICSDTGHHPLDIKHGERGRKLYFAPRHWAHMTAKMAKGQILKLNLPRSSSPQDVGREATIDVSEMVAGPYKYEKDLHVCYRVSIPGRNGRLVACVYATAGEDQAEADAELFARSLSRKRGER